MNFRAPRGTKDLLPEEASKWQYVEQLLRTLSELYNYEEIRTPVFEHTEVFQRGVGDTTDIVQKEMYTFEDRGGRSITLRPEGTAGVVRAYVQHKLHGAPIQPTKFYYFSQMFRYERPQHGRMRQLHQFGVEVLGSDDPSIDAEVIALAMTAYKKLGLKKIKLIINSLGDTESRHAHREALIKHFTPHVAELCADCNSRLMKNPLRILDCKADMEHPAMDEAPSVLDYLNEESAHYFEQVKQYLDEMEIEYVVDPTLVRGLDYYNHTAFEIMSEAEGFGAITTLLGGGRYNRLTEQLGGPASPGIGFGMGLERTLLALENEQINLPLDKELDVFVVTIGENVQREAVRIIQQLREASVKAEKDYQKRKIRAQFRAADRLRAKYTVIIGEEEVKENIVKVRTMKTGEEIDVAIDQLVKYLKEKCGG